MLPGRSSTVDITVSPVLDFDREVTLVTVSGTSVAITSRIVVLVAGTGTAVVCTSAIVLIVTVPSTSLVRIPVKDVILEDTSVIGELVWMASGVIATVVFTVRFCSMSVSALIWLELVGSSLVVLVWLVLVVRTLVLDIPFLLVLVVGSLVAGVLLGLVLLVGISVARLSYSLWAISRTVELHSWRLVPSPDFVEAVTRTFVSSPRYLVL